MSASFEMAVKEHHAEKILRRVNAVERRLASPKARNAVVARGVANLVAEHLFGMQASAGNRNHWPRQNFYAQAAKSVNSKGTEEAAVVGIAHVGIRQRYEGGTIRPTNGKKYLAIPARAEAYGRLPREFNNLEFKKTARGGMLVEAEASMLRGEEGGRAKKKELRGLWKEHGGKMDAWKFDATGGGVMYWLVPFVVQQPDHRVLPAPDRIWARAVETLNEYMRRAEASVYQETIGGGEMQGPQLPEMGEARQMFKNLGEGGGAS